MSWKPWLIQASKSRRGKLKKITTLLIALILMSVCSFSAIAEGTGKSYVYDSTTHDPVEIPDPYTASAVVGTEVGLKAPMDMCVYKDSLYVLDSINPRVVVLNKDLTFNKNLFVMMSDGTTPYPFIEPKGLWLDKNTGLVYIAERSKQEVLVCTIEKNANDESYLRILKLFKKPVSDLMSQETDYLPTKILTDDLGVLYIRVENEYRGLLMIDKDGTFLGYFGSNTVTVTADALYTLFWRRFMTEEQIKRTEMQLPMEYSNMSIDTDGFIFGVRGTTNQNTELIRKVNSKSKNVLSYQNYFGDMGLSMVRGERKATNFNAITVDAAGFITVVDSTWDRLFQYNSKGELMYVFGGSGQQAGTFATPVDIESWDGNLLVLDKDYATVTRMTPTTFGTNVRLGESLYNEGEYTQSKEPWQAVLSECMNYQFAYVGLGKVLYMEKDYKGAMNAFKIGNDSTEYSTAFKMYRAQVVDGLFIPLVCFLALLVAAWIVIKILKRRGVIKKRELALDQSGKFKYMWYTMFHPIDAYEEMRYNRKYSLLIANVLAFLFFFSAVLSELYGGFVFNGISAQTYNVFITLCVQLGVLALFTFVNWLMSTFLEGKGGLKEVWIYLCYATLPYVLLNIVWILLSNVFVAEEGVFLGYIVTIGEIWMFVMVFYALRGLHMYTIKRTVASIAMTVLGMMVVLFIVYLMFNLFIQFFSFIEVVYKEIMYRVIVGF